MRVVREGCREGCVRFDEGRSFGVVLFGVVLFASSGLSRGLCSFR